MSDTFINLFTNLLPPPPPSRLFLVYRKKKQISNEYRMNCGLPWRGLLESSDYGRTLATCPVSLCFVRETLGLFSSALEQTAAAAAAFDRQSRGGTAARGSATVATG